MAGRPSWPRGLEVAMTTLKYALIGMAALAALEFYAMMVGTTYVSGS